MYGLDLIFFLEEATENNTQLLSGRALQIFAKTFLPEFLTKSVFLLLSTFL